MHLAPGLHLPVDAVTQKMAWLGRTGSGKTYGATKMAELMLEHRAQIFALDPVGVWYGLRIGADFTIPVFGGLHGDVPLEPTAGAMIADVIVDRGISAVIDVSQFESNAAKARFAKAFADRFFFRKKAAPSAVHGFIEECQEFVPQNPDRDEAEMLGAFTRMAKLGRNFGIGLSLISQRPQEVNKKVLNMTEVMFAFQMRGPQERKTIKEWSNDKALEVDIESELPSLAIGEAFVSSPQWLQVEKKVKIARKRTADVSSTPKVGAAAGKSEPLTPIDMEQLRTTMAATIEKAKAEDPKELQRRIRELENQVKGAAGLSNKAVRQVVDQALAQERESIQNQIANAVREDRKRFEPFVRAVRTVVSSLNKQVDRISGLHQGATAALSEMSSLAATLNDGMAALAKADPEPPMRTERVDPVRREMAPGWKKAQAPRAESMNRPAGDLSGPEQKILDQLAVFSNVGIEKVKRSQLAAFVGYSAETKSFKNALASLNTAGRITYDTGHVQLTDDGKALARWDGPVMSLEELHNGWVDRLSTAQGKMLRLLIDAYPKPIARPDLAGAVGYSPETKSFKNGLSQMSSLGLVTYTRDGIVATDMLFPEGLR